MDWNMSSHKRSAGPSLENVSSQAFLSQTTNIEQSRSHYQNRAWQSLCQQRQGIVEISGLCLHQGHLGVKKRIPANVEVCPYLEILCLLLAGYALMLTDTFDLSKTGKSVRDSIGYPLLITTSR
ncbi:uncharacterized protein UTRI_02723 [Ustilago trichophora]|uniref:Uncharacterized protein n=1 Tax=Ustilago trichophora TaxID=86804 RepID=A0A5C3EQV4_9BASI|nr:uncharacterized protein UTRI_02723 [Ustilago trichophora]